MVTFFFFFFGCVSVAAHCRTLRAVLRSCVRVRTVVIEGAEVGLAVVRGCVRVCTVVVEGAGVGLAVLRGCVRVCTVVVEGAGVGLAPRGEQNIPVQEGI